MYNMFLDEAGNPYQEFFKKKLKKWDVKSPSQLDAEKKKAFFVEVKKDWADEKKGDGGGEAKKVNEEAFEDMPLWKQRERK